MDINDMEEAKMQIYTGKGNDMELFIKRFNEIAGRANGAPPEIPPCGCAGPVPAEKWEYPDAASWGLPCGGVEWNAPRADVNDNRACEKEDPPEGEREECGCQACPCDCQCVPVFFMPFCGGGCECGAEQSENNGCRCGRGEGRTGFSGASFASTEAVLEQTVGADESVLFRGMLQKHGGSIAGANETPFILLAGGHAYFVAVSVSGLPANSLFCQARLDGEVIATFGGMGAGAYQSATGFFFADATDKDTVRLEITNASGDELADVTGSLAVIELG